MESCHSQKAYQAVRRAGKDMVYLDFAVPRTLEKLRHTDSYSEACQNGERVMRIFPSLRASFPQLRGPVVDFHYFGPDGESKKARPTPIIDIDVE